MAAVKMRAKYVMSHVVCQYAIRSLSKIGESLQHVVFGVLPRVHFLYVFLWSISNPVLCVVFLL